MRDKIKLLIVSTYNPEDISTAANAALIAYLPIIFFRSARFKVSYFSNSTKICRLVTLLCHTPMYKTKAILTNKNINKDINTQLGKRHLKINIIILKANNPKDI